MARIAGIAPGAAEAIELGIGIPGAAVATAFAAFAARGRAAAPAARTPAALIRNRLRSDEPDK